MLGRKTWTCSPARWSWPASGWSEFGEQEETEDEGAFYAQPLFDVCEGRVFGKWNRNRVQSAHKNVAGTPPLTDQQRETMDLMDDILSREEFMYRMWLEPGDMQIVNNHVLLHSRTDFEDFDNTAVEGFEHVTATKTVNGMQLNGITLINPWQP